MIKVDLEYIYNISDNDRDFIKEMLTTFVKITPESVDGINYAFETKNWKEMGRIAHKIKPSILLLGIDEFSNLVREIEQITKNEIDIDSISVKISLLNKYSLEVLSDIDDLLTTGRY
ncbi:Hpt domain-containing protein [Reichenbachiella sp. MALMAid0571]|uniref:Hpt domain-containing protein n=1 Tax=Reichenbachiella sp. MALMAid0571 TaxID=3143939 RepID=UPI0032DE309F